MTRTKIRVCISVDAAVWDQYIRRVTKMKASKELERMIRNYLQYQLDRSEKKD